MLGRGAAIGFISSAAGLGWEKNLELLGELLATPDFDSAVAWVQKQDMANYFWMKQAVCAYVSSQAFPMLKRGIRINAICPGPTDTPLAQANKDVWLAFGADFRAELGIQASTPIEQAYPLLFLCSEAATAHQRHHAHHRRRLHELRDHGLVPERHHDGEGADGPDLRRGWWAHVIMLGTLFGLIVLIFALVLRFDPEARGPSRSNGPDGV